jgi:hypothetical protein
VLSAWLLVWLAREIHAIDARYLAAVPGTSSTVVATAPGRGPDWIEVELRDERGMTRRKTVEVNDADGFEVAERLPIRVTPGPRTRSSSTTGAGSRPTAPSPQWRSS